MHSENNDYHISFFRPTTDSARRNRNMVLQLVIIWAVAIFGFQLLLKILEKPVPEEAFTAYETYRSAFLDDSVSPEGLVVTGRSTMNVLSKVAIKPEHRESLDNTLSWIAYSLAGDDIKEPFVNAVNQFEATAAEKELNDPEYLAAKAEVSSYVRDIFGLNSDDVRAKIAPLEIKAALMNSLERETRELTDSALGFYLVHNRSVLTDFRFLGFPFHYFYTAVFLLILFVGLCLVYCIRTDYFHKKYVIED